MSNRRNRAARRRAQAITDVDQTVKVHPHTPWGITEAVRTTVREIIDDAAAAEHPQHGVWVGLEKAALRARGVDVEAEDFDINEQAEVTADEMVARGLVNLETLWELTGAHVLLDRPHEEA